jgi:hypothetical protein
MNTYLFSSDFIAIAAISLPFIFLYLFLCINKPLWFIAGIAIYLPFEEFLLKWVPDLLYTPLRYLGEVTIFVLLFIYVLNRIFITKKWPKTPIDIPVLIIFGAIICSALINHTPLMVATLGLKNLWRYIALFYLIVLIRPSEKYIFRLLKVLLFIAIVQSLIAFSQTAVGKPAYDFFAARDVIVDGQVIRSGTDPKIALSSYRTLVFGTMGRYNVLGNYLAMWLGIAVAMLISKSNILKIKLWQTMLLFGAMLLSYSRMSWVSFLLGSIILFLLSKKNKFFAYASIFLIVIITLLGSYFAADSIDTLAVDRGQGSVFDRYLDIFSSDYWNISLRAGRGYSYLSIVPAVLKVNPLLGLGPGMIASDVSSFVNVDTSQVSAQLQLDNPSGLRYLGDAGFATIISQVGLVGFVGIVLIFVQLFRSGFSLLISANSAWRPMAVGYIILLAMMIVFNLVSFSFIYRVPSFYFWMFSAFIVLQQFRFQKKNHGYASTFSSGSTFLEKEFVNSIS